MPITARWSCAITFEVLLARRSRWLPRWTATLQSHFSPTVCPIFSFSGCGHSLRLGNHNCLLSKTVLSLATCQHFPCPLSPQHNEVPRLITLNQPERPVDGLFAKLGIEIVSLFRSSPSATGLPVLVSPNIEPSIFQIGFNPFNRKTTSSDVLECIGSRYVAIFSQARGTLPQGPDTVVADAKVVPKTSPDFPC